MQTFTTLLAAGICGICFYQLGVATYWVAYSAHALRWILSAALTSLVLSVLRIGFGAAVNLTHGKTLIVGLTSTCGSCGLALFLLASFGAATEVRTLGLISLTLALIGLQLRLYLYPLDVPEQAPKQHTYLR
jgi:hypothetical protein